MSTIATTAAEPAPSDSAQRAAHLQWCKLRACNRLDCGMDLQRVLAGFTSDLGSDPSTETHPAPGLGLGLLLGGYLRTPEDMRRFIQDTH